MNEKLVRFCINKCTSRNKLWVICLLYPWMLIVIFINISVISWRSLLFVEKATNLWQVTYKHFHWKQDQVQTHYFRNSWYFASMNFQTGCVFGIFLCLLYPWILLYKLSAICLLYPWILLHKLSVFCLLYTWVTCPLFIVSMDTLCKFSVLFIVPLDTFMQIICPLFIVFLDTFIWVNICPLFIITLRYFWFLLF